VALAPKKKEGKRRRVVKARLDDVVERMLASMSTYGEVVDHCVQEFEIHERTVATAIARVKASWKEAEASTVEERRAKFRAELEHAWKMALAEGDYRAIAVMARTRADIEGIKASKKVEHGGVIGLRPVAVMSPAERRHEIAVLLAKQQAALGPGSAPVIDVQPGAELAHDARPGKGARKARVH
jgi:uncharacterized glyoxalase superfamily metalloenzyme YdcJ